MKPTLPSPRTRFVIGSDENITGDLITAYIPDAAITLTMRSGAGRPVVLDQRQGKFIVPDLYFTGEGLGDNTAKNANHEFRHLRTWRPTAADETCQNQFIDENARLAVSAVFRSVQR